MTRVAWPPRRPRHPRRPYHRHCRRCCRGHYRRRRRAAPLPVADAKGGHRSSCRGNTRLPKRAGAKAAFPPPPPTRPRRSTARGHRHGLGTPPRKTAPSRQPLRKTVDAATCCPPPLPHIMLPPSPPPDQCATTTLPHPLCKPSPPTLPPTTRQTLPPPPPPPIPPSKHRSSRRHETDAVAQLATTTSPSPTQIDAVAGAAAHPKTFPTAATNLCSPGRASPPAVAAPTFSRRCAPSPSSSSSPSPPAPTHSSLSSSRPPAAAPAPPPVPQPRLLCRRTTPYAVVAVAAPQATPVCRRMRPRMGGRIAAHGAPLLCFL